MTNRLRTLLNTVSVSLAAPFLSNPHFYAVLVDRFYLSYSFGKMQCSLLFFLIIGCQLLLTDSFRWRGLLMSLHEQNKETKFCSSTLPSPTNMTETTVKTFERLVVCITAAKYSTLQRSKDIRSYKLQRYHYSQCFTFSSKQRDK